MEGTGVMEGEGWRERRAGGEGRGERMRGREGGKEGKGEREVSGEERGRG